jgi:hypothetical protein
MGLSDVMAVVVEPLVLQLLLMLTAATAAAKTVTVASFPRKNLY